MAEATTTNESPSDIECFVCPILMTVMESPVITPSGKSYERRGIEDWLKDHNTDPLTRQPLKKDDLIPNLNLRDAIATWKLLDMEWKQKSIKLGEMLKKRQKEVTSKKKLQPTDNYLQFRTLVNLAKEGRRTEHKFERLKEQIPTRITGSLRSSIEAALLAITRNDGELATSILEPLVKDMPDDDWLRVKLGLGYQKIGSRTFDTTFLEKAIEEFTKAVETNKSNAEAHDRWGWTLSRFVRIRGAENSGSMSKEAIEHYKAALRIDPEHEEALFHYGVGLRDIKKTREAVAIFKEVTKKQMFRADAYKHLGQMAKYNKDYEQAISYFDEAINAEPECEIYHFMKGKCYLDWTRVMDKNSKKQYLFRNAKDCFEKSMKLNSSYHEPYVDYGFCLTKIGPQNYDKAREYYERALKIDPMNKRALRSLKWLDNRRPRSCRY